MDVRTRRLRHRLVLSACLAALTMALTPVGSVGVRAASVPKITSITPAAGLPGATVVITGVGFGGPGVKVTVGGATASVTSASGTRVEFRVPAAAPVGRTTLVLTAPSRQTARTPFTVVYDGRVTPVLDASAAVSATVGRAGGSLASKGVRLTIPEGALSTDVAITLTPLLDLRGTPLDGTIVGGAHLEPSGLTFLRPGTLTFPQPAGVQAHQILGFSTIGDADLHLVPRSVSGGLVTIGIQHFTDVGGTTGGGLNPSAAEAQALTAVANATAACDQERAANIEDGPACAQRDEKLATALRAWYYGSVEPNLEAAIGAAYGVVDAAFNEWIHWAAEVQQWARIPLESEAQTGYELARRALEGVARTRLGNCTGSDLVSQLRDVVRVSDMAKAAAFDELAPDLPSPLNGEIIDACAHVAVTDVHLPAVVATASDRNTLTGRAVIDVWNGPDRVDPTIAVQVEGLNFGVVDEVTLDPSGAFEARLWGTEGALGVEVRVKATTAIPAFVEIGLTEGQAAFTRPARPRIIFGGSVTSITPGSSTNLLARLAGDDVEGRAIAFSVVGDGSVSPTTRVTDASGLAAATYTAAWVGGNPTVTASLDDPGVTRTASVAITVSGGISVSVTPTAAILAPGAQQTFVASVTGTPDTVVVWSATCGSITSAGVYTAPGVAAQCVVTATSHANSTQTGTASVSVVDSGPPSLRVSPAVAFTAPGGHVAFSATFTNHPNAAVSWSVSCGTIDSSGAYTAPATLSGASGGVCSLLAQSADGLRSTATIEIGVVTITAMSTDVDAWVQDFAADPIDVQEFFEDDLTSTASVTQPNHRASATLDLTGIVTANVLTVAGTATQAASGSGPTYGHAASGARMYIEFVVSGGRVPWSLVANGDFDAAADGQGFASTSIRYTFRTIHLDPTASIVSATHGALSPAYVQADGSRAYNNGTLQNEATFTPLTDAGWLTRGRYSLEIYLAGQETASVPGSASASGSITSAFSAGVHP